MATFSTIYSSNIFSRNIWGASWLFLFCCFYRFAVFCSVLPQPINLTFSWWGLEFFFNATENKFTHRSFWVCANAHRRQIPVRHCRVKGQVHFPFWWMSPLALNHVVYHFELPPATNEVPVAWRKDLTSFDFKWQQPAYPVQDAGRRWGRSRRLLQTGETVSGYMWSREK